MKDFCFNAFKFLMGLEEGALYQSTIINKDYYQMMGVIRPMVSTQFIVKKSQSMPEYYGCEDIFWILSDNQHLEGSIFVKEVFIDIGGKKHNPRLPNSWKIALSSHLDNRKSYGLEEYSKKMFERVIDKEDLSRMVSFLFITGQDGRIKYLDEVGPKFFVMKLAQKWKGADNEF